MVFILTQSYTPSLAPWPGKLLSDQNVKQFTSPLSGDCGNLSLDSNAKLGANRLSDGWQIGGLRGETVTFSYSYPIAVVIGVAAACFAGPNPANRQSTTAATSDRTATP